MNSQSWEPCCKIRVGFSSDLDGTLTTLLPYAPTQGGPCNLKDPPVGVPSKNEIECLAYKLWEKAGQPKGRDQEFYLEAERQLEQQVTGRELKIPGNR